MLIIHYHVHVQIVTINNFLYKAGVLCKTNVCNHFLMNYTNLRTFKYVLERHILYRTRNKNILNNLKTTV